MLLLFEIERLKQYEGGRKFEEIRGSEAFTSGVNVFNMQPLQVFSGVTMRGRGGEIHLDNSKQGKSAIICPKFTLSHEIQINSQSNKILLAVLFKQSKGDK